MILQSTMYQKQNIDLSSAPWTMHEFFAGSGLVAYGLRGMFTPVWANDISEQKAAVYEANFGCERFILDDIKNVKGADLPFAHLSWASFPCQDLSLAGSIGGIHASRSGLVWEWLRVLDEMDDKPKILLLENVAGLLSTNGGDNYRVLHMALVERGYRCGAILLNASHFVPQSRPRVFIIAVQENCPVPDELVGNGPCGCITTLQRSWAVNYRDGFGGIRKSLRAEPHLSKISSRMTQPLIKTMLYVWFPNGIGPNCGRTTPCTLQAIAERETESSSWSCALMELLVAYGRRKAGAANSIWLSRRTARFTPAS